MGCRHVRGATKLTAAASELSELLEEALQLRRSEATERNPLSSRSHATGLPRHVVPASAKNR